MGTYDTCGGTPRHKPKIALGERVRAHRSLWCGTVVNYRWMVGYWEYQIYWDDMRETNPHQKRLTWVRPISIERIPEDIK